MSVTITEFRENMNHYFDMVVNEDVIIIEDGEIIAKLTYPRNEIFGGFPHKLTKRKNSDEIKRAIESVSGIIPENGMTLSDYRTERLAKYEDFT